jgi:crotonobetainyl-CoA:carnitine CoA-transferase CaiB-like acyl-CoA transferase
MAETGLLGLSCASDGAPCLPPVLVADLAGGAFPAIVNILLALLRRERTGEGAYLDIAMAENLLPLAYWGLGSGFAVGEWPHGSDALVTGRSPRYQIYRTADDCYLAAAPIENRFWENFCSLIGLPDSLRDPRMDAHTVKSGVTGIIASRPAEAWRAIFEGHDVCCSVVASLQEAAADPHFAARGLFDRTIAAGGRSVPALPVPIAGCFRTEGEKSAPRLGADNAELLQQETC